MLICFVYLWVLGKDERVIGIRITVVGWGRWGEHFMAAWWCICISHGWWPCLGGRLWTNPIWYSYEEHGRLYATTNIHCNRLEGWRANYWSSWVEGEMQLCWVLESWSDDDEKNVFSTQPNVYYLSCKKFEFHLPRFL